jgi:succinyl-CoA synthetase alpha subunit
MSILVDETTRVICQGITGRQGAFHTRQAVSYGTKMVGGVTPGKGGEDLDGLPIFNTVSEAVRATQAEASVIYVPGPFAADAIMEAADAGIGLIICITEGIPVLDMVMVKGYLSSKSSRLIGPTVGVTSREMQNRDHPGYIHHPGKIKYLLAEPDLRGGGSAYALGHRQPTCVGIGGDPIIGLSCRYSELFLKDPETGVMLIGEIGGGAEEEAAEVIRTRFHKPVVAFIAGQNAPPGRRMGHAGAVISGNRGSAQSKMEALRSAGAVVVENPAEMGLTLKRVLQERKGS